MDEDEDEDYETGYILGNDLAQRTIPPLQGSVCCARFGGQLRGCSCMFSTRLRMDRHRTKQEPNLVSASGHELKHYGEQAVPMKLRDGRKIWITFQVCNVNGPIMSVGKFCAKGNDRCATLMTRGGTFVARRNVLAPVQAGGSSGSAIEPAGRRVTVLQRADAGFVMDTRPQGAYAPRLTKNTLNPRSFW